MEFILLNEEEFNTFTKQYDKTTFLQTSSMANYQKCNNRIVLFPAVKDKDAIICGSLIYGVKTKIGVYFSCPRGFLIDYSNKVLLKFYTENLKKLLKNYKGYVLNIEPDILYHQRDIDGNIIKNGFNNQSVIDDLIENGFKHNKITLESDPNKQVRWTFRLTYCDKSEEEVFNNFNSKTKRIIKKALKSCISIKEVPFDELDEFKAIIDYTGKRKSFGTRSLKYYQDMYNSFDNKSIKFLAAYFDIDAYRKQLNEELNILQDKVSNTNVSNKTINKIEEYNNQINAIDKRIELLKNLSKNYPSNLMISAGMFLIHKDTTTYLFGGSNDDFMFTNSQFLLQWEVIKYGINNNCTNHDFYGISGDLQKSNAKYGVYEFKRGFDGCVEEYIGDFDLVLRKFVYYVHKAF